MGDEIMRVVEDVTFLPESINGKARELDWLRNMGDWMISKKRFWVWHCQFGRASTAAISMSSAAARN